MTISRLSLLKATGLPCLKNVSLLSEGGRINCWLPGPDMLRLLCKSREDSTDRIGNKRPEVTRAVMFV